MRNTKSETRLWCAVILQALVDMDGKSIDSDPAAAKRWLLSNDEGIGSLWWICEILDLDYYKIQNLSMSREGRRKLLGQDNRRINHAS